MSTASHDPISTSESLTRGTRDRKDIPQARAWVLRRFKPLIPRRARIDEALGCAIGEDVFPDDMPGTPGSELIAAWSVLDPSRIALLSALGRDTVSVVPAPRVAILSAGAAPASVTLVRAMCEAAGARVVADEQATTPSAIAEWGRGVAQVADLLVMISGDRDRHVRTVLETEGRVEAIEAGAPAHEVMLGRLETKNVLGLSGGPPETMLTCHLYVQPAIAIMAAREDAAPRRTARAAAAFTGDGLPSYIPARLTGGLAHPVEPAGIGRSEADGFAIVPPGGVLEGTEVTVELWR